MPVIEAKNVNVDWVRKREGIYYGDGAADLAKSVALAAHGLTGKKRAEAAHNAVRLFCSGYGQDPDIETFMREENGGWRVSWEAGPYEWAMPASDALYQVGILAEPYYSFDLCFYPED